ncbi:MAG TPA: Gfo/Idh/MocA family oxidoreductase [Opitutaceae bacterium]|jgi:predicted dehydrogenase
MEKHELTRRDFIRSASVLSAASIAFPYVMRGQGGSPNGKLNIACVGVGGRGADAVAGLSGENFVAFCDVDDVRAAKSFAAHPEVGSDRRFRDFRRMLDKFGNEIDAVTVSTPDHMHFAIAMAAISMGKHVFVEKPLTHTITEARALRKAADEKGVQTQMGNQGHAGDGCRTLKEWVDAGVLGDVTEVHSWTDRPIWPQGVKLPDHSKMMPVVPHTLDWDLWLGVAAMREYDPAYLPFTWRGYWDFGTGALGDMGCHILDGAFYALDLGSPTHIEAISARQTEISPPKASMVKYDFPARGSKAAVRLTWYDGGLQPPPPPQLPEGQLLPENGTLLVGSKATVFADTYYDKVTIIPEEKMAEMASSLPPKTIPRVEGGHFKEWVRACKGGPKAGSNFDYSSRLTEVALLSNVAIRARRPIDWDGEAMAVTNHPDANQFLKVAYRPGFGV